MHHGYTKLSDIISISNAKFKELKKKHPRLRGYLVFSSRFGQAPLKASQDLILEFPKMFSPAELVNELTQELNKARELKKSDTKYLDEKFSKLTINDEVYVELRFDELLYELIGEIQKDPLVQPYTPIMKSSIRIVLLKISEIAVRL